MEGKQSEEPKLGDLIEFFQGSYSHWGVYVGDRNLVHLSMSGGACSSSASGEPSAHAKKGLVKKVSLSQIEEWGTYEINNMYDKAYCHRPIKEIVHDAEDMVQRSPDIGQRSLANNCKHFAMTLRYGEINMSMRMSDEEPNPGDLIEFFKGPFSHWGVYVGYGNVVHLTTSGGASEFISSSTISSSFCVSSSSSSSAAQKVEKKGHIMKNPLSEMARETMYIVNNKYDKIYSHKPVKQIVCDAEEMVGEKVDYNLLSYNCEHFACELRYGIRRSEQVEEGIRIVSGFASQFKGPAIVSCAALVCGVSASSASLSASSSSIS